MVEKIYNEIRAIKKDALQKNISIITDDLLDYLINFITKRKIVNILEIGNDNGYFSIMLALSSPNINVVSIEKDKHKYLEAVKNVKKVGLEDRITLIYKDALDFKTIEKYDLIFIDATKGKNKEIFEKYQYNLATKGYIITNNTSLNGHANKDFKDISSFNLKMQVKKLKRYILYLEENNKFKTSFIDFEDGLAISEKK